MIRSLLEKLKRKGSNGTSAPASAELRRSEQMNTRLLAITESAHDMIATFDLRGRILYLNRAGYQFLGIGELDDKNGMLERYLSIPTTLRLVGGLRIALERGYWQDESEWLTGSGIVRTASQTVVAHQEEGTGEPYFSTIVRDISDRKEIERQLLTAKHEADRANEAKSSFLARMSHELRTPLNGITGLTHLLQRSELTEVQREHLRQIAVSSSSLLHILNDLLDYSKLEADKLTIENVPFRLDDSLERLSGTFAVLLGTKPIDLIVQTEPELPQVLYGDPARLEQVLLNLVNNAIKFTEQGYICLHVGVADRSDARTTLRFSVTDTGIGMKPEQLAGLFQPFVQADEATSRTYGGTGLGLVICRSLVERMGGGEIRVRSRYREGSTFVFEIPFAAHDGIPSADQPLSGLRVLVLEDSTIMRDYWLTELIGQGCRAETAADWESACGLLAEGRWDIWIADMEAGDMYGDETWALWKKEADRHGVSVICSTSLQGRDAVLALNDELRPAGVLVKPVTRPQMIESLRSLKNRLPFGDPAASTPAASPPFLQGSVLVVEDNEINRLVAKQLLEGFGLTVKEAENGLEALRFLERHSVDMILMDLNMPEMDGWQAVRRIRLDGRWNELVVVAMTAESMEDARAKCLQAGMNDLVAKPVDPEALYRLLSQWLPAAPEAAVAETSAAVSTWPDTDRLDIALALHRLDGKTALYLQLLDRFCNEYADFPSKLRTMQTAGETRTLQRLLHSFRGAAAHLGAIPVAREALVLEEAYRQDQPVHEQLGVFEDRLLELIGTIRDILRQKRG